MGYRKRYRKKRYRRRRKRKSKRNWASSSCVKYTGPRGLNPYWMPPKKIVKLPVVYSATISAAANFQSVEAYPTRLKSVLGLGTYVYMGYDEIIPIYRHYCCLGYSYKLTVDSIEAYEHEVTVVPWPHDADATDLNDYQMQPMAKTRYLQGVGSTGAKGVMRGYVSIKKLFGLATSPATEEEFWGTYVSPTHTAPVKSPRLYIGIKRFDATSQVDVNIRLELYATFQLFDLQRLDWQ